jgi:hypothetical protein
MELFLERDFTAKAQQRGMLARRHAMCTPHSRRNLADAADIQDHPDEYPQTVQE